MTWPVLADGAATATAGWSPAAEAAHRLPRRCPVSARRAARVRGLLDAEALPTSPLATTDGGNTTQPAPALRSLSSGGPLMALPDDDCGVPDATTNANP